MKEKTQQKVEVELSTLQNIVEQAAYQSQIQYRRLVTPDHDKLKQREAKRYLQQLGYEPKILDEWVQCGFVHKHKDGQRNSAVYYSLREIQRQLTAIKKRVIWLYRVAMANTISSPLTAFLYGGG